MARNNPCLDVALSKSSWRVPVRKCPLQLNGFNGETFQLSIAKHLEPMLLGIVYQHEGGHNLVQSQLSATMGSQNRVNNLTCLRFFS